jgi:hypothetical protein
MRGRLSFLKAARQIRLNTGKSIPRQLVELASLRFSRNPIGISEYFDYGIWNPSLTAAERRDFLGWRQSAALDRQLNHDWSRALANDKLLTYLILRAHSFPIPKAIATYSKEGRTIGGEISLRTKDDVLDFLSKDVFPFFVKPISAGFGRGVLGVSGWGRSSSELLLRDGSQISLDKFLSDFDFPPYQGRLFQGCLEPHPSIARLTGTNSISCIRLVCFVTPEGATVHTGFWKIVSGTNMLDNFSHGDFGNCLSWVDVDSGEVTSAISKMGVGGEVINHPSTGKKLIGFVLPDWNAAVEMVCSAAVHFPGLRLQNWDVALCANGPVLVEVNTETPLPFLQAIRKRGLVDDRMRTLMPTVASRHADGASR